MLPAGGSGEAADSSAVQWWLTTALAAAGAGDGNGTANDAAGGSGRGFVRLNCTAGGELLDWNDAVLWVVLLLYLFVGIYVVCDYYFVPALEVIGDRLQWSESIQGASLMAAGSSFPEFLTALFGVLFFSDENPGPATNIGSAVFNICCIVSFSILFLPPTLPGVPAYRLHPVAFWRDCGFFVLAAVESYVFFEVMSPGELHWSETLTMAVTYALYIGSIFLTDRFVQLDPPGGSENAGAAGVGAGAVNNGGIDDADGGGRGGGGGGIAAAVTERLVVFTPLREGRPPHFEVAIGDDTSDEDDEHGDDDDHDDDDDDDDDDDAETKGRMGGGDGDSGGDGRGGDDIRSGGDSPADSGGSLAVAVSRGGGGFVGEGGGGGGGLAMVMRAHNIDDDGAMASPMPVAGAADHRADAATAAADHRVVVANAAACARCWARAKPCLVKTFHVLEWPYKLLFRLTIPSVRLPPSSSPPPASSRQGQRATTAAGDDAAPVTVAEGVAKNGAIGPPRAIGFTVLTFFLGMAWLGIITFFTVDIAEDVSMCMGFGPSVTGLTVLAMGTSLPDCLSSIIVARRGRINMAVSNALGSNVFDLAFCVGFPFFLKSIITGMPVDVGMSADFSFLISAVVLLALMLMGLLLMQRMHTHKFQAYGLLGFYVVFLITYCTMFGDQQN